jgi:hypothetical protein
VPPDDVAFTVTVGNVPFTVTFVPAVILPVAVTVTTPEDVIGEPETEIPVPAATPTLVTVPPLDGLVFVTVYVGKDPATLMPVPAVKEPVPDIVNVPELVIGEDPEIDMPVPATAPTDVTVPPDDVALTVTVGKEPLTVTLVPAAMLPVAETVIVPLPVNGEPETLMPVPADIPID